MIAASNPSAAWLATAPSDSLLDGLFAPKQAPAQGEPFNIKVEARGRAISQPGDRAISELDDRAISELDDIDALVKKYRPRLLRFVTFSLGDPDLAETITQDALLKAYNARDSFRGDSSVNTFLVTIALNLIRDQQRTQKFRFWKQFHATALDVTDVASFVTSRETSPEAQLLAKEKVERLYTIIAKLSFTQRTVFLMKFSDEMDVQEISKAMSMPVNTVKTHLHRSLKTVRRELGASQ